MARKKGKSRRRKAKHGTPASPAASTQAAARGFIPSQLEGPFPDPQRRPSRQRRCSGSFRDGSYLPSTVPSSRPGSQVSRVTGGDNPSPAQHQAGTALVAIGGDFRHANSSGGREPDWRRRPSGDRDTGGDRDRPAGDHCHNGESLSGEPLPEAVGGEAVVMVGLLGEAVQIVRAGVPSGIGRWGRSGDTPPLPLNAWYYCCTR